MDVFGKFIIFQLYSNKHVITINAYETNKNTKIRLRLKKAHNKIIMCDISIYGKIVLLFC